MRPITQLLAPISQAAFDAAELVLLERPTTDMRHAAADARLAITAAAPHLQFAVVQALASPGRAGWILGFTGFGINVLTCSALTVGALDVAGWHSWLFAGAAGAQAAGYIGNRLFFSWVRRRAARVVAERSADIVLCAR
jgi:hypothetical protein